MHFQMCVCVCVVVPQRLRSRFFLKYFITQLVSSGVYYSVFETKNFWKKNFSLWGKQCIAVWLNCRFCYGKQFHGFLYFFYGFWCTVATSSSSGRKIKILNPEITMCIVAVFLKKRKTRLSPIFLQWYYYLFLKSRI